MAIRKVLAGLLLGICMMLGLPAWVLADGGKGQVSFVLSYEEEGLERYRKEHPGEGEGAYIFVQSIDDGTIYRFPLNASNNYGGRFDIPYGNYKVVPDPEAEPGQAVIAYGDVFAVSDNTPIVEIICNIEEKEPRSLAESETGQEGAEAGNGAYGSEKKGGTKESPSGNPAGIGAAAEDHSPESGDDSSSRRGLTGQNIFTILMICVIFGLWIYNRFIKKRS